MTNDDLAQILHRKGYGIASTIGKGIQSTLNTKVRDSGEGSNVERGVGLQPIREEKVTLNYSGQCVVRIKAFRRRLCDPDGNCTKFHLDFLRYCGAIKEDNDAEIRLIFEPQEKVERNEEERCEITVEYPSINPDNLWSRTIT